MSSPTIRTFIVDDHPVLRVGVAAVLAQEQDIAVVAAVTEGRQMWRTLGRVDPDERGGTSPRPRATRPR